MTDPRPHLPLPAALGEGVQASLFFAGLVIINNLDIILVKHFFAATEAGVYAAVALVGRVVYVLSWSVVSSMFPFSAGIRAKERDSRCGPGNCVGAGYFISGVFTLARMGCAGACLALSSREWFPFEPRRLLPRSASAVCRHHWHLLAWRGFDEL